MPVLGQVALRRHLFARETAFGTPVPAVRAYPLKGVPTPNLNWIRPDADQGSLYPVVPRYKGAPDLNFTLNHNALCYNDLVQPFSAFFGGAVASSGGGTAKTWEWTPDPAGGDDFDSWTYEFGDDADGTGGKPNDWMQYISGILTGFTIDSPEQGAGVLTLAENWKFSDIRYAGSTDIAPTSGTIPSITDRPDKSPTPVYLKDCSIFMDSDASDIGGTQLSQAVHKFTLTASQEVDEKRYADGLQSFAAEQYGHGLVTLNLALVYAKTADTVGVGSESDAWSSDTAVDRFITVHFESTVMAEGVIPYSWDFSLPMWYFQREESNIGNNATVTLTAEAHLDDILDYAFTTTVVNTLTDGEV